MTSETPKEPVYYNSLYRHGVDEKRHVQIPAKWRPEESEVQFTLVLWPKGSLREACLLVLPPDVWRELVAKLKALPFRHPDAEALRRVIGGKSDRVALDKAGRMCIPEELAKAVGIEKEALLVGMVDRFEIWNPERHTTAVAADEDRLDDAFNMI